MIRDHFPPEIKFHKKRFDNFSLNWLEDQFAKFVGEIKVSDKTQSQISYQNLADFYLNLLESDLPVDAEIAYVAVKLGVITGKLTNVLNINWSNKAPSILLYQGLANMFMNNFGEAEKLLVEAENKASKENDDAVLLETWGIQI
ncbi:MAG: hypothetical protein ACW967_08570, partial [Candidatus Hodarchaeales archaeon]